MTFEELCVKILSLKCEKRTIEANYMEVVANNAQLETVNAALTGFFGPAAKPAGKTASPELAAFAKPYGGIYENQTLYYKKEAATIAAAFLWPWGSGTSTTVKILQKVA